MFQKLRKGSFLRMIITQLKNSFDSICKSNGRFFRPCQVSKQGFFWDAGCWRAEAAVPKALRWPLSGQMWSDWRLQLSGRTLHKRVHPQEHPQEPSSGAISHVWVKPGQKRKEMLPKVCKYQLLTLNLATTETGAIISHLFCFPLPPLPLLVGEPSYCKIFWLSNKSGANT